MLYKKMLVGDITRSKNPLDILCGFESLYPLMGIVCYYVKSTVVCSGIRGGGSPPFLKSNEKKKNNTHSMPGGCAVSFYSSSNNRGNYNCIKLY